MGFFDTVTPLIPRSAPAAFLKPRRPVGERCRIGFPWSGDPTSPESIPADNGRSLAEHGRK
ncbi:hypothetical protein ABTZ93_11075 [Streptomyces sp. NPDC097941]|uniref:hypothetical protein n=1 Tax=Streptomyces sp. NPDC097941 TaxID=3155685 RepID=UPI00331E6843